MTTMRSPSSFASRPIRICGPQISYRPVRPAGPRNTPGEHESSTQGAVTTVLYWLFKFVLIGPFLRLTSRRVVTGRENFPRSGAALLVGNHLSVGDWLFMPLLMPRRVTFLAKSDYFTGT